MSTRLFLKKLDINSLSNLPLKQSLNTYMNSYENYFNNSVPLHNNNNYSISFSLKKPQPHHQLPLITSIPIKKELPFIRKNTRSLSKKATARNITVNEKEINAVFDNFKRIKETNRSQKKISNDKYIQLQMQENALCRYDYHQRKNEYMKNKLSKSLKRGKETLLIDSIDDFREKKEEKILGSRIDRNKDYWYDSLRQPIEKTKLTKRSFYKNFGTFQNPKWKITSLNYITECIRSPIKLQQSISMSISDVNKNNKNSFSMNNTLEYEQDEMDEKRNLQLAGLNVVGKDLLEFEMEHFNEMKNHSKKFYMNQIQNDPSDEFEILSCTPKLKEKQKVKIN